MAGVAPVSYREIEAWARIMDIGYLHPLEVEAITILDAALLSSGTDSETTQDEQVILPSSGPSWPKRKAPPEES